MLENVFAYIDRHQLLPEQGEVLVGVSGGTDSLCLIHLLSQACTPGARYPGVRLRAAHLNHMLRGQESAEDANAVAGLMEAWNIPCTLGKCDVPALALRERRSLEDAARVARYRFLRAQARDGRIAVAHHADDQVETLVLHWLRGSGLAGQVGMQPRQGDIIRPLLEITRAETLAYCQAHHIHPLEDQSNSDPRFLRNRVRHELLPLLRQFNPGLEQTLLRGAEVARIDLAWLEEQVESCWPHVVVKAQENEFTLTRSALETLSLSLQRHLLRRVTARLCAGQSPLEPRHFALLESLLRDHRGGHERVLHLPQGLRVHSQNDTLIFEHQSMTDVAAPVLSSPPAVEEVLLPVPGAISVPGTVWRASAQVLAPDLTARVVEALRQRNWPQVWRLLEQPDPNTVYIDGESVTSPLRVRAWRPGDRMQPLGMENEKKLQDIFVDKRIARSERATIPLFFSDACCLWAAGVTLSHRARLTSQTRRILRLSIQPQ